MEEARAAHGSAADVPALLAKLDGKVARDGTLAAQQLLERVALPCSALPALTAALLSRLEDAKRKDRAAVWGLVVEVVVTEPQRFVFEPFTPPKRAPKPLRDALEALFRTMKYRPGYPRKPFGSVEAARRWVDTFVAWYDDEHLHSGIRYATPSDRHAGRDVDILANRREVYARARKRTPRRWTCQTRDWTPVGPVPLNRLHPDVGRRDVH